MEKTGLKQLMFAACSLAYLISAAPIKASEQKNPGRGQASSPQRVARQLFPAAQMTPDEIAKLMKLVKIKDAELATSQKRLTDAERRASIALQYQEFAEQRAKKAEQDLYLMSKEAAKTSAKNNEQETANIVARHCGQLTDDNRELRERSRNDARTIEQLAKTIEKLKFQKRANREDDLARAEFMYEHGLTQEPPR